MTLTPDEQKKYNDTIKLCCDIEKELHTTVDTNNGEEIAHQLESLRPFLANCPTLIANATELLESAKGQVADIIMNMDQDMKHEVMKQFISGKLAKFSALYARAESLEKNLRSSVEGLRSILSYQKELTKNI